MNTASEGCYRETHSSPTARHHDADDCDSHGGQHHRQRLPRGQQSHDGPRKFRFKMLIQDEQSLGLSQRELAIFICEQWALAADQKK